MSKVFTNGCWGLADRIKFGFGRTPSTGAFNCIPSFNKTQHLIRLMVYLSEGLGEFGGAIKVG
jgi:hypothetical protein